MKVKTTLLQGEKAHRTVAIAASELTEKAIHRAAFWAAVDMANETGLMESKLQAFCTARRSACYMKRFDQKTNRLFGRFSRAFRTFLAREEWYKVEPIG